MTEKGKSEDIAELLGNLRGMGGDGWTCYLAGQAADEIARLRFALTILVGASQQFLDPAIVNPTNETVHQLIRLSVAIANAEKARDRYAAMAGGKGC